MEKFIIITLENKDSEWAKSLLERQWGSVQIVRKGKMINAIELPGFIAELHGRRIGLITYNLDKEACEIVTLDSLIEGKGIGSRLMDEVIRIAKKSNCRRVWLITTNDNTDALRFYQKRGFLIKAFYPNAIAESRKLKPQIPINGKYGIPIRDEIELEMRLDNQNSS